MTEHTLTPRSRVAWRDGALAAEVGGEVVLMSVERGNYYGLDAVGSDIWRRLEEPMVVAELVAALSREYEADAATIEADVLALLDQLLEHGLIETRGAG